MWYEYHQNNSGGYHTGPALVVWVEADSADEANARFLTIDGCYFDDEYEYDCDCCGTRWYAQWSDDNGYAEVEPVSKLVLDWVTPKIPAQFILGKDV